MDWTALVIGLLVFVLPIVFEGSRKRKNRNGDMLPGDGETADIHYGTGFPENDTAEEGGPAASAQDGLSRPGHIAPVVPETRKAGPERIDPRKLIIYSEIMRPKFLEK